MLRAFGTCRPPTVSPGPTEVEMVAVPIYPSPPLPKTPEAAARLRASCLRKFPHPDPQHALDALRRRMEDHPEEDWTSTTVYRCQNCTHWHTGRPNSWNTKKDD